MNMSHLETMKFLEKIGYGYENKNGCEVVVCPPATSLRSARTVIDDDNLDIKLGAQNMHFEQNGAFTGETSPLMIKALGVEYVILGHSERRKYFGETDEMVNKKVKAACENSLKPIMCVGEPLEIRESGKEKSFILSQLVNGISGINSDKVKTITVTYEPIWAIGTGKIASSENANDICKIIREKVLEIHGSETAEVMRIQYGGSVKPSNVSELLGMSDIDGVLVGKASLEVDDFLAIINY